MSNHYHLLVYTLDSNLSAGLQFLNSQYAYQFNRHRKKDGPVFKGRFKSIYIENEKHLLNISRYIHLNPVNACLVKQPEKYYWSSYQDYVNSYSRFSWLSRDLPYIEPAYYEKFCSEKLPQKIIDHYSKARIKPIFK